MSVVWEPNGTRADRSTRSQQYSPLLGFLLVLACIALACKIYAIAEGIQW